MEGPWEANEHDGCAGAGAPSADGDDTDRCKHHGQDDEQCDQQHPSRGATQQNTQT